MTDGSNDTAAGADVWRLPGDGTRRIGVEIEFGGLGAQRAADIAADTLGGRVETVGPQDRVVEGTEIGRLEVYLDTRFRDRTDSPMVRAGLGAAEGLIPIEVVTEPLPPQALSRFEAYLDALAAAGADGTGTGVLKGFGIHFNVEAADTGVDHLWRILLAYGLIEHHLRARSARDFSRRVLPFIAPWPAPLVDWLAGGRPASRDALIDGYLAHVTSRNHGLDAMPILAHIDAARVDAASTDTAETKPRPAWHYRLPDSHLGQPGWRLSSPWAGWRRVERLAGDTALMERVVIGWRESRRTLTDLPQHWAARLVPMLEGPGGLDREALDRGPT